MRVPEIQARLRELSKSAGIAELDALADELARRSPKKRVGTKSAKMTPALRAQIARHAAANPGASQVEIATHFNVNPGRVSETVTGFRR